MGSKVRVRVTQEVEEAVPLISAATHAWSYPVTSGTENILGSLLSSPPKSERLRRRRGAGGVSHVSQPQCFNHRTEISIPPCHIFCGWQQPG